MTEAPNSLTAAERPETTLEHIARDMREGIFPRRSEPGMVLTGDCGDCVDGCCTMNCSSAALATPSTDSLLASLEGAERGDKERGPVRILCDEIGFPFDERLERDDVLIAFVSELVSEVERSRDLEVVSCRFTGKLPSAESGNALALAKNMVATDLGLSHEARMRVASALHDLSYEVNPDDATSCDHLVDMLSSCASAIRFGLDTACRSRHAADAADHVWKQTYGVSRFDRMTPAWRKDWARQKLQSAIISLLPEMALNPKPEGEG